MQWAGSQRTQSKRRSVRQNCDCRRDSRDNRDTKDPVLENAAVLAMVTAAIRVGSRTGKGRKIRASEKLNIAEVAPMPMASEQMLTSVNPGLLASSRRAWT